MTTIYADNAATTQMSRTAIDAMLPYLETIYGNPSSLHSVGQQAAEALLSARDRIAKCLNASPREIYFTSGGSEADNQAILSAARLGERKGKKHIISTAFEHHAMLHTLQKLEKEGFTVELLPVGPIGTVTAQQVKDAIREDTCLASVMYANNEIGSILPVGEIGAVCRAAGAMFSGKGFSCTTRATSALPPTSARTCSSASGCSSYRCVFWELRRSETPTGTTENSSARRGDRMIILCGITACALHRDETPTTRR